ncbi:p8 nuclear protein, partial [Caligus rogercresseyi]
MGFGTDFRDVPAKEAADSSGPGQWSSGVEHKARSGESGIRSQSRPTVARRIKDATLKI